MGTGTDSGGSFSFNTSFSDINAGLFGQDTTTTGNSSKEGTRRGTGTTLQSSSEKLNIDKIGLLKMIDDALKGVGGLTEIFSAEAKSGLFDGSTAKQGTEDLIAKIAGELAKVTGEKVTSGRQDQSTITRENQKSNSSQESKSPGIVEQIFGGIF